MVDLVTSTFVGRGRPIRPASSAMAKVFDVPSGPGAFLSNEPADQTESKSVANLLQGSGLGVGTTYYVQEVEDYASSHFNAYCMKTGFNCFRRISWFYKGQAFDVKKFQEAPFKTTSMSDLMDMQRYSTEADSTTQFFFLHYGPNDFSIPSHVIIRADHISIIIGHTNTDRDYELIKEFTAKMQELFPVDKADAPNSIPVTFWVLGSRGPAPTSRQIDASQYANISGNYSEGTKSFLDKLVMHKPLKGGEMILMSGEPGTGKTHALRALFQEWKSWADFHYIVDPTTLFGGSPEYLMRIILGSSNNPLEEDATTEESKWRVILMEDVGELISSTAKEQVGQGLSQLLNVTDGLLGQGLKLLLLMTTNERIGNLHPAICRPGRCAYHHEFTKLSVEESKAWLDAHKMVEKFDGKAHTIAELYAMITNNPNQGQFSKIGPDTRVGFIR